MCSFKHCMGQLYTRDSALAVVNFSHLIIRGETKDSVMIKQFLCYYVSDIQLYCA